MAIVSNSIYNLTAAKNLAMQINDYATALEMFQWQIDNGQLPKDYDREDNALAFACPTRLDRSRLVAVLKTISE